MIDTISKPYRKLAAVALLLALVALFLSTTVLPVLSTASDLSARIDQQRQLVAKLSTAAPPLSPESAKLMAASLESARREFIAGESQTIRFVNVQTALTQILTAPGLKPRSVRNLPPRTRAGLQLIGVQVQVYATLAQVQSILMALEAHRPRLLVEDMQIVPVTQSTQKSESLDRTLDVRLEVFGIEPPPAMMEARK